MYLVQVQWRERRAEVFPAEFSSTDLAKLWRKLRIGGKKYFTFAFINFRELFAAWSLQNALGEVDNCI